MIPDSDVNKRLGLGTTLYGSKVNSRVCITTDQCVESIDFVAVTYQSYNGRDAYFVTSVVTYGGALGLSPDSQFTTDLNIEFNLNGSDPSFALYLSDNNDSFLQYGPED